MSREFELLLQVCCQYVEDGLPIPVDTFMELREAGIDPDVVEDMLEEGMFFEEIKEELLRFLKKSKKNY